MTFAFVSSGPNVRVIDTDNDTIWASVPVGGHVSAVALSANETRLYAIKDEQEIVSINAIAFTVVDTLAVGSGLFDIAVMGGTIYVSDTTGNRVRAVDEVSFLVLGTQKPNPVVSDPLILVADETRTLVYVTSGAHVLSIPGTTNDLRLREDGSAAVAGTLSPDGNTLYVVLENGPLAPTVAVIDLVTFTLTRLVAFGTGDAQTRDITPRGVATTVDEATLFVVGSERGVLVKDAVSDGITTTLELDYPGLTQAVERHPVNDRMYIVHEGGTVFVIDPSDNSVFRQVSVGAQATDIAIRAT